MVRFADDHMRIFRPYGKARQEAPCPTPLLATAAADVSMLQPQVSRVDRLTRVAVMARKSKWNLVYVVISLVGFGNSLSSAYERRSACYAFCLLDVSVRYRAMHR